MAGFTVHVTPGTNTISVSAAAAGGGSPQTMKYAAGSRVYFVETTYGDDSGSSDYDFSDDGVVVTTAGGKIIQ